MGDDQTRRLRAGKHPLPEHLFRLDIECARQVIEDQQLRVAHEHTRGGRALYLPSGELDSPRTNHRVQASVQFRHVAFQDRRVQGNREVRLSR